MTIFQLGSNKYDDAIGILWIDLETTGTDETVDDIIEIGAILTTFNFEVQSTFETVVRPEHFGLARMMFDPVVRDMHTKNGLLEECIESKLDISGAEKQVLLWLNHTLNKKRTRGPVEKFRFMLAGSGVGHFDRRFIKEHMPNLDKLLTRSPLDIGMVRRFIKVAGVDLAPPAPPEAKNHRALDDIRLHLDEAVAYKAELNRRLLMPL